MDGGTERGPDKGARAVPAAFPDFEEVKRALEGQGPIAASPLRPRPAVDRSAGPDGEGAGAPPAPSEAVQADQAFEQRLQASEEDLRAELRAIPEVRLLSDGDVRDLRADERAAQERALKPSQASLDAAGDRLKAAQAQVAQFSAAISGDPHDTYLHEAIQQAARASQEAGRAYSAAAAAHNRAVAAAPAERAKIGYDFSQRMHRTLKGAAAEAGLSLQSGLNGQLTSSTAAQMATLSKDLRDRGFVAAPGAAGGGTTEAFAAWCDEQKLEGKSGTVPTLTQLLQVEDEAKRFLLVRELARIPSEEATTQLAVRAVADLSPEVRRAAVAGLGRRPWQQYGPVLLRGLRYPWPPVADHAAVALRALGPQEAVAPLVDLLDLPSPSDPAPDAGTGQYAVRELVRLNHLRNCLLCHAPSADKADGAVRGLVPTPGEALPVAYYESQDGDYARADRTFLRQDFSVKLTDDGAAPWPCEQRYDFVTRVRTLPPGQATGLPAASGDYPQRGAVLYALRGLTGKDGGESSARWRELLGAMTRKPKQEKESPALEKLTIPLAGTARTR
jgi:hypothetical protein